MAARLAKGAGPRVCPMIIRELDLLQVHVSVRLSITRDTQRSEGLLKAPDPHLSITRDTSGPPTSAPNDSNEGPVQPALRRFRVSAKSKRLFGAEPPLNHGLPDRTSRGRFAAFHPFAVREKGGCMSSA
jgi:hypothetical protein